jgi:hypothetical protein
MFSALIMPAQRARSVSMNSLIEARLRGRNGGKPDLFQRSAKCLVV